MSKKTVRTKWKKTAKEMIKGGHGSILCDCGWRVAFFNPLHPMSRDCDGCGRLYRLVIEVSEPEMGGDDETLA